MLNSYINKEYDYHDDMHIGEKVLLIGVCGGGG